MRVSDAVEGKTIFASLFDIDSVLIKAKAAAKFVDKNMAVDFDYLMKTYGVETIEAKDENPFVDIPTEPKNFRPTDTYSILRGEDDQ